ncbi:MAG: invasin domain 3-containing protein, partial [Enterobacterales bacterium]|uniref:Ig-like domain-containing protein n=1 Tax=Serratia sp. (in: enterobacteria) TaxID=616 RepID=UPI003F347373
GDTMTLTVMLEDSYGNRVSEQTAALAATGAVTVPNTTFVGPWAESSTVGTYTAAYSITAGEVSPAHSEVVVQDGTLPADGTSTTVATFTARDADGNPVTGLAPGYSLTGDETGTEFSGFTESGSVPGTYTGTRAGTASLMPLVNGAAAAKEAATLTLTAGEVDPDNSTVAVSPDTIVADGSTEATVTYSAKDAHDNPVSGLTGLDLRVEGVTGTTFSEFTDNQDGTYTDKLVGSQAGSANLMPRWNSENAANSAAELTLIPLEITGIRVNGYTFTTDAGFPKTAFAGATFQILINGESPAAGVWKFTPSNTSVTVTDTGQVTVVTNPTEHGGVTIEVTPDSGGPSLTYVIGNTTWFTRTTTTVYGIRHSSSM